jgi:hypothetical protein
MLSHVPSIRSIVVAGYPSRFTLLLAHRLERRDHFDHGADAHARKEQCGQALHSSLFFHRYKVQY